MKRNTDNTLTVLHFYCFIRQIKSWNLLLKKIINKALLLLYILPAQVFAQDITGLWTGFLETAGNQMHYELAITENKGKFAGYSITVFTIDRVENTGVKSIKLKNKKGDISFEDYELIFNNYTTPPKPVKLFGDLTLKTKDSIMILEGTFITRSKDIRYINENVYKGTIFLQKQKNVIQTKLISKLEEMGLLNTLSFMAPKIKEKNLVSTQVKVKEPSPVIASKPKDEKTAVKAPEPSSIKPTAVTNSRPIAADITVRKTEILRTVFFKSDSLVFSLYDNGQVDGDTVSVILNGKIIIANKGLTATAITQTIYTPSIQGDSLLLIMYAENLGAIPPNTGLLILQDGDERYEIRFEGDFQKNSAIRLKKKL